MNKRRLGAKKEEEACLFLQEKGYEIIDKNFYSRYGELDLVCKKKEYLVFVEVKYRREDAFGYPSEAVTRKKQRAMYRTAEYYLYKNQIKADTPCRFDVVSILGNEISLIENCMEG